jgi:hypothetical protein
MSRKQDMGREQDFLHMQAMRSMGTALLTSRHALQWQLSGKGCSQHLNGEKSVHLAGNHREARLKAVFHVQRWSLAAGS